MATGGCQCHQSVASNLPEGPHLPGEGQTLQPSVSPVTPNPEPRFPKDEDAHPRAASASARRTPPPPPMTGISTVNWRTEIPELPQSVKQVEETASHAWARLLAQNTVQPTAPAQGQGTEDGPQENPSHSCGQGPQAPNLPRHGPTSAFSAGEAASALRASPLPKVLAFFLRVSAAPKGIQHFLRLRERHTFIKV